MKNQILRFLPEELLKQIKTKNMPLGPKQQPPYYVPEPMPTPPTGTGNYQRLNAQFTAVQTSGTTETDLYTYTLTANTLTQNGDALSIKFTTQNIAGNGDSHIIRFYFNTIAEMSLDTIVSPNIVHWEIHLVRISTTQVAIQAIQYYTTAAGLILNQIQTANTIDFTTTIPIKFTGQCTAAGEIQTYLMTIDKITI